MKIVFISNYFNHHQRYISDALFSLSSGMYSFIETQPMDAERKALGWGENNLPGYVHYFFGNEKEKRICRQLMRDSDIIIVGSASEKYLLFTHFKRKIILRYSERPFKLKKPPLLFKLKLYILLYMQNLTISKVYMLCASAYTASDYGKMNLYRNRTYKWGYFPELKKYDIDVIFRNKKNNEILWCGRFLDWKHPDLAIKLAKQLVESGYQFHMTLIGSGPMEQELKMLVKDWGLSPYISFCGTMKPQEVRNYMEQTGIFLFTSDRMEGWGVVLNEAMNSACAVVANTSAGATPFLVKHMDNGLCYDSNDDDSLYSLVKLLLENKDLQRKLGTAAYTTITTLWNPENAASKLCDFIKKISSGYEYPTVADEGPCSKV